ncbi:MAG: hypothetical protein WC831_02350, partial [Parcubacteria group bacterium]
MRRLELVPDESFDSLLVLGVKRGAKNPFSQAPCFGVARVRNPGSERSLDGFLFDFVVQIKFLQFSQFFLEIFLVAFSQEAIIGKNDISQKINSLAGGENPLFFSDGVR